ncbi:MAG TPA: hypothetical protein VKT49_17690 [Bryobacteraceae bacterium]|nr:hypothetical protein [Bryobacteraceae bacterium]
MKAVMIFGFLAAIANAGPSLPGEFQVCLRNGPIVEPYIRYAAQTIANRIFGAVGVKLVWSCGMTAANCPKPPIIELTNFTPENLESAVLATTRAYERIHITVYYRRIEQASDSPLRPNLLGHVLAHEIMHIIEGTDQHSDRGVMKRRWDLHDYNQMGKKPLGFTDGDITLMHSGLARWLHCQDGPGSK